VFNSGENFEILGDQLDNDLERNVGYTKNHVEDGSIYWRWIKSCGFLGSKHCKRDRYVAPYISEPEIVSTYQLPILNQDIDKTVIAYKDGNISDVKDIDSIKTAIETLTNKKLEAAGESDNLSVDKTNTEDALKLLEGFIKAENNELTDAQKQQLQDLLNAKKTVVTLITQKYKILLRA